VSRRGWLIVVLGIVGVWLLILAGLGIVAAVALGRFGGGAEWDERVLQGEGEQKVAVIHIDGEIHGGESAGGPFGDGGAGARDITSQIRQATEDDDVEAIILSVDSPGGAVVASDEIARAVRRLRRDKPVVASMGDLAASGGYYIASQAQRVIANPGTITGSIGVIAILPNLEGTAAKLGIRPVVLKSGALKDVGSPFRDMTPDERELYQRLLDEAHEQFIAAVAQGRRIDAGKVREVADGRPFSGLQAKVRGLVDELGDLETAYDAALEIAKLDRDEARLVEYRKDRGFGGLFPFGVRSPVDDVKRELGLGFGLQYLYLP
jgi:protease-4